VCFHGKTCINHFQKGIYVLNISKLQKYYACITQIVLNAAIEVAVFENSLSSGNANFTETGDPPGGRSE